ncbi:MAG: TIGR00341 family protein [Thermoproteota archaeon]|nr:TIGR00341 family protein [Thermoproteota archaeon]
MERIEITVHPNQANEIEKVLEQFKVPYIKTPAESYKVQCIFYVVTTPQEIASILLDTLAQKFDSSQIVNTITHYKTESTVSEYLRKFEVYLREEQEDSKDTAGGEKKIANADDKIFSDFKSVKDRIRINKNSAGPAEGLLSKTDSFLSRKNEIYVMILVATVVALVGLVTNNVAIIIGAMLISPFLGPISSIAANLVLGRRSNAKESVIFTTKMILSSIGLAALLTAGLSFFYHVDITSEIQSRTDTNPIFIIVAVMLGIAGGLAMLTAIPEIIVGVAIAVALVPPATTVGIGLGLGSAQVAEGASFVLLSNIFGLLIGFTIIFLVRRISPGEQQEKEKATQTHRISIILLVSLAIALAIMQLFFS